MGQNIVFGWKKDEFDITAKYHIQKVIRLPDTKDLSQYIPQIGDQDGVGACTGFGFGGETSTVAAQLGYIQPKRSLFHSANWIYNGARKIRGWLNQDSGAYPDDCANWIVDNSLVSWIDWPFEDKLDTTDPDVYKIKAIQYTNRAKFRVDNGAEGIMSALAEGHPIAIGIPWASSWMNYTSGILPEINSSTIMAGGHEVFLWGYIIVYNTGGIIDYSKSYFLGSNSWGTSWGILIDALGTHGGFKIPMSVFEVFKNSFGGYDAHYITFESPVTPVSELSSISLEPKESSVVVGNKKYLTAVGIYTDGTSKIINDKATWINENSDIVYLLPTGEVTAASVGKANIYTVLDNVQSNYATIEVTPKSSSCPIGKKLAKVPTPILAALRRNGRFYYMDPKIKDANKK